MPDHQDYSRRKFMKQAVLLGAAAPFASSQLSAIPGASLPTDKKEKGFTFLFQGDSITDGNRTRNNDWNHVMGHGYAYLIASRWGFDFPRKEFRFFNRGVSGNKVPDLAARWQEDTLALKPDLLSILVGINDADALLKGNAEFTTERFEAGYRALLAATRTQLPQTEFVLCEPFVLPVGRVKEKWEAYRDEVAKRRAVVQKIAADNHTVLVPLQSAFDRALSRAPAEYWIWDGVHPMPAGHELIAREWMEAVRKRVKIF